MLVLRRVDNGVWDRCIGYGIGIFVLAVANISFANKHQCLEWIAFDDLSLGWNQANRCKRVIVIDTNALVPF